MNARFAACQAMTLCAALLGASASGQEPLGTAFTYQGQLTQAGAAVDGTADFQIRLFDASVAGNQIGLTESLNAVAVSNGLFTVALDFGVGAFNGDARWLEIAVRNPAGGGTFTTLAPRQPLTAAPYALKVPGMDGHSLDAADGAPADVVLVNNAGLVGIGTPAPASKLHITRNWDGENGALRLDGDRPTMRLTGGALAGNETWLMHIGSDGPGALQFFRRQPATGVWLNYFNIQPTGNVGIGALAPNFQLSLGSTLSHTKIALYDGSPTNHYGMGVVSGQFSFHLNSPGARYAFYDSDDLTNEIFTIQGNGVTRVKVLEITGADIAEKFPTTDKVEPGMVVAIDPQHPGKLCMAREAYNRRVAGVVSGANDFSVGAVLGNLPGHEDSPPIALSGRVYVRCDASTDAIEPGDLLTTSDTPGHAMKATHSTRMAGAVLGKAMTGLGRGERGLVLALVSLQ